MKKINIIKESKDFDKIIHNGRYYKNKYFIIYISNNDYKNYRFGISVGKKISNKAVIRNKIKRRIKSIIDNHKNFYQNNKDYIIIMKRSCLEADFQELENNFIDTFNKITKKGETDEKE